MLSSDPRRPLESASPAVGDPRNEPGPDGVDGPERDSSLTIRSGSSGSAQRRPENPPMLAPIALPRAGDQIDTFRLEEAIGAGGMGAVFRALDTQLDRHVALKLLPPDQAEDGEVVRRFYQEGRSAAQLDHENIARVYSIGQEGILHYIAFEYIEGQTIRQRVEGSGPLPVSEAVDVALQIAQALVHAAERGVVHRDIKPSNIILTPHGRAKLVDMGLARRFERGGDHGLTQSGMTLGTFDYISPEQARDPRDVDVRSDLYSLGCTLFHMLTGRPPFPGGTVLQKLIQHQEEAPADVRTLNAKVPAELAAVITRLMAKDRDRRYQSPEQLVRDLLGLAAVVGLDRGAVEFQSWLAPGHRPTWERHLVWLLPAVGFFVVISGLIWWGREFTKPSTPAEQTAAPAVARPSVELGFPGGGAPAGPAIGASASTGQEGEASSPIPAYPRTIPVSSNEDLLSILATAPRRSVVVLADDGPYRVGDQGWPEQAPVPLVNADLTIKAEAGVRPRVRFAVDAGMADAGLTELLHFVGGHVTIEGLEFELDAHLPDEPVAAIRVEDAEVTLRGCSFRRPELDPRGGEGRHVAAIEVRSATSRRSGKGGERPPAVFADSCHFDGGQLVVLAEGPSDITFRDCTMGPARTSIWFDNTRAATPVPIELRLLHSSILAGAGPVFRFDGTLARVWVDDSVIAPAGRSPTSLVMMDDPRRLTWRGRSNVYARIGPYLVSRVEPEGRVAIADFSSWEQTATELREAGSRVASAPVWESVDPLHSLALERENPSRVFLLHPGVGGVSEPGARRGPFGSILTTVRVAQRVGTELGEPARSSARRPSEVLASNPSPGGESDAGRAPTPAPAAGDAAPPDEDDASPTTVAATDPMNLPAMPPMATAGAPSDPELPTGPEASHPRPDVLPGRHEPAPASVRTTAAPAPSAVPAAPVSTVASPLGPAPYSDEDLIRSTEQFLGMYQRLGPEGGSLWIAAGAELELPTVLIRGTGRYQIQAEPGPRRPRIRFQPPPPPASPTDWIVMLDLRSGSLHLQGLDLIVPEPELLRADRVAAASLLPGTMLTLSDCTLTHPGRRASSSVFLIQPPPPQSRPDPAAPQAAVIRLRDCFLRSGCDGVTVAAGRRLTLELANVLIATDGSLLHALSGRRSPAREAPAVQVKLDRVTARVKGGLVHLDSTPDEPELSAVELRAENTIVSTTAGDDPLFRLEGQDELDPLRDKIRWEGRKVAYHRIKTYRRDEIVQTGVSPRIYDRNDWTYAFLPKDESPILGDVKFLHEAGSTQAAWKLTRDSLRLAPESPVAGAGPDLNRIPQAPAEGER